MLRAAFLFAYLGLSAALLVPGGCDLRPADTNGGKPVVVATTTMIGDLARRIGGDRVTVQVMMPPGTDPHTFKPAPADIAMLSGADLVFYNGLHLEGTMVNLFENPRKLGAKSAAVSDSIPEERLLAWQQGQAGVHDPHVWFNAELWAFAALTVRDRLISLDRADEAGYRLRAKETIADLLALHEETKRKIASIPRERRVLITSHDAYSYFGRAYDIDVRGLQGISTETEAGLQMMNAAVDFISKQKIPAIFVETSVSPKTIEAVQRDVRQRGFDVRIGGELYSDAMGRPGERPGYAVETYTGMFRYNVDTLVGALK